ncbi:MAG TPA: hypothetical protein VMC81_04895 [Rhodocyclaceae bacterium]|nr:hypothetical protein [Rhodocyclaceae bacterium]
MAILIPAWFFGDAIVSESLPLLREELQLLVPELEVLDVAVTQAGADSVISVEAAPTAVVVVAGQLLPIARQSRYRVSTLAGHVLQPIILAVAIVAAWPGRRLRQIVLGFVVLVPFVFVAMSLDVPVVLAAELHSMLLDLVAPDSFSILIAWKDALEGGGRFVLAMAAAAAAVSIAARILDRS